MHHVKSDTNYDNLRDTDKLVVVKFSAEWCGPCKMIAPKVEALAEEHTDVVFIHVDVDQLEDLPDGKDVHGVPTFKFYKNKKLVESFAGANEQKIRSTILKHK